MPSFDYSLTGTFHVLAPTQAEADLKAQGFVLSSLRLFLDTYEYKPVKQEQAKQDDENRDKHIQRPGIGNS